MNRRRLVAMVSVSIVQKAGSDRIIVELPGIRDRERALAVVRSQAFLEFKITDKTRALVLISYPLHPPGKPEKSRTEHLPQLKVPCLFVSGTRDAFGTVDELEGATAAIPGPPRRPPPARRPGCGRTAPTSAPGSWPCGT